MGRDARQEEEKGREAKDVHSCRLSCA